jgi:tetratricopeptide (TPR) repeat protein
MTARFSTCLTVVAAILVSCSMGPQKDTLAELRSVDPDLKDVSIEDSLERAEASYRRYLEEKPSKVMVPEAMRRMADLQIEKEFGIIGTGELREIASPDNQEDGSVIAAAMAPKQDADLYSSSATSTSGLERNLTEADTDFESRASGAIAIASETSSVSVLPAEVDQQELSGPREAIETYKKILQDFPTYERNDQVLYQMSRAYDELGEPDEAMRVMERLVAAYPFSRYADEVFFRRGEYYFVRKKYMDAEEAYQAIIRRGPGSRYYELALYKLGWSFYKQELYPEALDSYIAMLDHRLSSGQGLDESESENDSHRVTDTFRVISLSFSNMGGPEVIDEYFAVNGTRSYGDRIYSNLGEFYLDKLRYQDAADVYGSFVELNPYHEVAPKFGMRIVEIYEKGEFPLLVVESKKDFASRYALTSDYWSYHDIEQAEDAVAFLKTNLMDLATHYHAMYQNAEFVDDQPQNYQEALTWYRQFLDSFPQAEESPAINYQLADLILENGDFGLAAREYERTAYDYPQHDKSSAAGYAAVFAHRKDLDAATGARRAEVKNQTVISSLRFVEIFPEHEQAAPVLGAAADDLYAMQDFERAIASARQLISQYPEADSALVRSAWIVVAHSSIDIAQYADAEYGYSRALELTAAEDESRPSIVEGLAAAIYKQGEQANLQEDYAAAADHYLRIGDLAPGSEIAVPAAYDGAAALIRLEDWPRATAVLEDFRAANPEHELTKDATKQLAAIYRDQGDSERSALEHVRVADESEDPELSREALLIAGELYEEAMATASALEVYERYVAEYPDPLDIALETRSRMAEIYKEAGRMERYRQELRVIVAADLDAGARRTERTQYLGGKAALVLTEDLYWDFARLQLVQPFERSLAEKKQRMDVALDAFESLVEYEVAEVTAAATFYIGEMYFNFSESLLDSERPSDLTAAEIASYELVLEEEAYPFEEQAIDVHKQNFELLRTGVFNPWVQRSLDKLGALMPGRYAKAEISSGFLGAIDFYAYRMPSAIDLVPDDAEGGGLSVSDSPAGIAEPMGQMSRSADSL